MFLDRELVESAAGFVAQGLKSRPEIGFVAGSGLGEASAFLDIKSSIPYDIIPGFPVPTVRGHDGELVYGLSSGVHAVFMRGRVHYYEGRSMAEVVFPVALLHALGVRTLILMSAVGGIADGLEPGTVMVVEDHINLMGDNPLRSAQQADPPDSLFVDMSGAYDSELRNLAHEAASTQGAICAGGVLAAVRGPVYETPAEVRMLKSLGADAVCMSMVPEVIAARYFGMRVLGLAVVTNRAAGLSASGPNHDGVLEVSSKASSDIARLLGGIVRRVGPRGHE